MKRYLLAAGLIAVGIVGAVLAYLRTPLHDSIQHVIAQRSADSAFHARRINVLLLGYQADEGNSDTLILAHLDIERRTATLVSIPRDTWVDVPKLGHAKINAAIGAGGPATSAKVVSALMGTPIDATIAVEPEGAKQLVDAMGGMNVNVESDMDYDDNYGNLHIHLKKGEQYLTGGQVLGYLRFRHDVESDWGRVRRQQTVLKSLVDQMSQPQNWAKLPKLLELARNDVKTTLSDQQLAALMEIYRGVPDDNIRTFTLPGRATFVGDASVVLADERWAKTIGKLLFARAEPPQEPVLVVDATGQPDWGRTVVAALRGGGWNVPTFVVQPARAETVVQGGDPASALLAAAVGCPRTPKAKDATLVLGTDSAPRRE
ncbi:MAG: LCP family protein [Candidatus Eremiobacteraeota bacterium]|nr:LCP family protein [Candidatus Eremiobacteraeota bacterium]